MLTANGCRDRQARLWDALGPDVDTLVVTDPVHVNYLAAFYPSPFAFGTAGGGAILVLRRGGPAVLVTDNILEQYAIEGAVDEVVAPVWYDCSAAAPRRREQLVRTTVECLRSAGPARLAVEPSSAPAALLRAGRSPGEAANLEPVLHAMRRRKDDDELALMRRAMAAGAAALDAARRETEPGMTELDVFDLVQRTARGAAGEPVLLYGDFLTGPRCAEIGGLPTDRRIEPGDPVLLDISVVLAGYRCDCANTFRCAAPPTDEQRRFFDLCQEAMASAAGRLRAGGAAADVDAAARGCFERAGVAERFPHHTGHGIGLTHPEAPFFLPGSGDRLESGNVVTIEPGLYGSESSGMRFERNYLVTDTGSEVLTPHVLSMSQGAWSATGGDRGTDPVHLPPAPELQ